MPFIATRAFQFTGGNIVEISNSTTHNFAPSSIWGFPSLQMMETFDDEAFANVRVTQFIDDKGVHNVDHIGEFASKCTSITYTLTVGLARARAVCITQIF